MSVSSFYSLAVIACDKRKAFAQGSEATKQSILRHAPHGLLRSARNDGVRLSASSMFRQTARGKSREDEINHLVERRPRFVGRLSNDLGMEEPNHRRAGAHRRERHVRPFEFT